MVKPGEGGDNKSTSLQLTGNAQQAELQRILGI